MAPRCHRTTATIIGEAWAAERPLLTAVPSDLLQRFAGEDSARPVLTVVDLSQRQAGEHLQVRELSDYEVVL